MTIAKLLAASSAVMFYGSLDSSIKEVLISALLAEAIIFAFLVAAFCKTDSLGESLLAIYSSKLAALSRSFFAWPFARFSLSSFLS